MIMNIEIRPEIHNLLINTPVKGLYKYSKDGIYIIDGPLKGNNLSNCYIENPDGVLDYLENIIDCEDTPYKTMIITKEVINDLENNQYV